MARCQNAKVRIFACRSKFVLSFTVVKKFNNLWLPFFPSFPAPCLGPVALSNGRVFNYNPTNQHGARLRFACNSGFKIEGPSIVRCNDGEWSSFLPVCKGINLPQKDP